MVIDKISVPEQMIEDKLKDKKNTIQFLPHKLKPLTKIKKIQYKGRNLKTAYIIDIVHHMISKYYDKKENSFKLNATVLKEKYGYIYNYYIEYLKSINIIHQVGNHLAGKTSREYKLDESILHGKVTRWSNTEKVLLKKYVNRLIKYELRNNTFILPEVKVKLILDLFDVVIDKQKSVYYLDSLKNPDNDVYNRNMHSVESIDQKHIFYHFDGYGRFHTNFTILKSFIRKNCLTLDGEETFEIDIPNSQPLFLSKMIEDSGTRWVKKEEYDVFRKLVENGNFYQFLCDKVGLRDKKQAKTFTYKVLFGKNHSTSNSDIAFAKVFPSIHRYIKLYKQEHQNYKMLSHTLQRMESDVIYNRIIKRIMILDPDVKMLTVHDSIIGKQSDRVIIERIFKEEIKNFFNL
jgi:hypothetical protein